MLLFQYEPIDGDLCLKCWQKTLSFHEFYVQIESIHETINQNNKTTQVKSETTIKCDPTFDDDYNWSFNDDFQETNDSDGETSTLSVTTIQLQFISFFRFPR